MPIVPSNRERGGVAASERRQVASAGRKPTPARLAVASAGARRATRTAAGLLALGALVLALPLAACGSGDGASPSVSSDDAQDTARLKLEQCLRDAGVDVPGRVELRGDAGGSGPRTFRQSAADMDQLREALEGPCKDEQQAVAVSITPEDRAAFEDAQIKMTACMKEHGVDMPSPSDDGRPTLVRIDADDEEVREAMDACRRFLPRGMGGPGPGGGPGGGVMIGPGPGR